MKTVRLKLAKIISDPDVQPRAGGLDKGTVEEYADRLLAGDEFPPPVVYFDGAAYWLSEGFHRVAAHKRADLADELEVEKRDGSKEDATLNALGSNRVHGLKRTNKDKRRAVEIALSLRPRWSDRQIADLCGVSHTFVAEVRPRVATDARRQSDEREGRDGRIIGRKHQAPEAVESESDMRSDELGQLLSEALAEPTVIDDAPTPPKVIPPPAVDAWGIPIQPHAAEAFEAVPKFRELTAAISTAQRLFNEVANLPGGKFLTLPEVSSYRRGKKGDDGEHADRFVHEGLETALKQVKAMTPTHTVCPWHYAEAPHPADCPTCRGLNWTPELGKNVPPVVVARVKEAFNV